MAQLDTKIKLYAEANGVANIDFRSDVMLQNDGDGVVYIKEWNLSIDEPTAEQIASYETAGNAEESAQTVLINRKKDYPSVVDQLDKIYHEGIDEWKKLIKVTKDKYPKE